VTYHRRRPLRREETTEEESPEDVRQRNMKEAEILASNLGEGGINTHEILSDVGQLKGLAQLQESMASLATVWIMCVMHSCVHYIQMHMQRVMLSVLCSDAYASFRAFCTLVSNIHNFQGGMHCSLVHMHCSEWSTLQSRVHAFCNAVCSVVCCMCIVQSYVHYVAGLVFNIHPAICIRSA
jgi:hypothetical protein